MPAPGAPGLAIAGIGVDAVDIERYARAIERAQGLEGRILSPDERAMPLASRAARFAAREAAVKALGGLHGLALRDLAVGRTVLGSPRFVHGDRLRTVLARLGVAALHLSLTHERHLAIAFVVAERGDHAAA